MLVSLFVCLFFGWWLNNSNNSNIFERFSEVGKSVWDVVQVSRVSYLNFFLFEEFPWKKGNCLGINITHATEGVINLGHFPPEQDYVMLDF